MKLFANSAPMAFNGEKETWNMMALLPILPNFSYRVSF